MSNGSPPEPRLFAPAPIWFVSSLPVPVVAARLGQACTGERGETVLTGAFMTRPAGAAAAVAGRSDRRRQGPVAGGGLQADATVAGGTGLSGALE
jgi:hypothetical protein